MSGTLEIQSDVSGVRARMPVYAFAAEADRLGDPGLQSAWRTSMAALEHGGDVELVFLCPLCGIETRATLTGGAAGSREQLVCTSCGLNSRLRAAFSLLRAQAPAGAVLATEHVTPAFVWLQKHAAHAVGGEYQSDPKELARLTEGLHALGGSGEVAFQDITHLEHPDQSFSAIVSFDVLEHVPDYARALSEFARVLKPKGVLIATFPFVDKQETLVRATIGASGETVHLLPPEYHGDPISEGVLCYYHFGWDILALARDAGFRKSEMVMPWSPEHGLHYGLWTLVCER